MSAKPDAAEGAKAPAKSKKLLMIVAVGLLKKQEVRVLGDDKTFYRSQGLVLA